MLGSIKDKIKDGKRYVEVHGDEKGRSQGILFPGQPSPLCGLGRKCTEHLRGWGTVWHPNATLTHPTTCYLHSLA